MKIFTMQKRGSHSRILSQTFDMDVERTAAMGLYGEISTVQIPVACAVV